MSAARYALVLHPDASFQTVEWPRNSAAGLRTLYAEIGCICITVVDLSPKVSMWLDDEGIINGSPVNQWATTVYSATAPVHQKYHGTAVFTGGTDARGNTTGLTRDNCDALLELAGIEIPTFPHQRTT
ncbi:DUF3846 domain-containing protein [Streptomyces kroppenstedtii]|uniref:DUF3846 domain-containing protein n=1 Tax=Streptomyces kroppenstedtii TaxID=3051181 RepID=UPI0028D08AD7|nr:DUF3846 domain-containing protein [Streptomyces sp. DSM 40484]